jgi:gamma-glutamylcyclotransferase (GGCT)/AIG2-like uncharacterized protein YtfP
MHNLFSYGTLQQENVQIATFGRKLKGKEATLVGYVVSQIEIKDQKVIQLSGKKFHPILKKTGNTEDKVHGKVFQVSSQELIDSDKYEVDCYMRKEETLYCGEKAWIYIEKA